ncbi:UNVERIFIED_CONTAM: hypothetical protein Cloal_1050 [Acetivibrio alkalicellulosi]
MNKEFIKKMLQAEILRYEAIKEILPEKAKTKIENMEKEFVCLMKDVALETISEHINKKEYSEKKETKKVKVDFL